MHTEPVKGVNGVAVCLAVTVGLISMMYATYAHANVFENLLREGNKIVNYISLAAGLWIVGCIFYAAGKVSSGDQDGWKKVKASIIAGVIIGAGPQLIKFAIQIGKGGI